MQRSIVGYRAAMTNRLADQTSPYLRQHAHNPVHWLPWGDEAFEQARDRDVPVLLSVGYSSCHWCHVMAHESFEDPDVAAVMNQWFVCIKVDREERPDVDSVYMDATQALTGRGGWPMTVFMDADGRPFYCGTYFPPTRRGGMPGFVELMEAVHEAWTERRDDLAEQAGRITQALGRGLRRPDAAETGTATLEQAAERLLAANDAEWGGFGSAPKFPQALSLDFLMVHHARTNSAAAWIAITTTLDAMASGGMVDLIGGGFSRYSVDERWLVPHFEKMLYDNALLLGTYARAAAVAAALGDTGSAARYSQVAEEIVGYVTRDLSHPDGGRFSAEDADSLPSPGSTHAEEGAFYTFDPVEVAGMLAAQGRGDLTDEALSWWGIAPEGNFEGRSIPNRLHARGNLRRPADIEAARLALLEARSRRPRPGLDDKVLTEWNALWIDALASAGMLLGREDWIDDAGRTARFLTDHLRDPKGRWLRSWQGSGQHGQARHRAYGSDLAALAKCFVTLYSATGSRAWLDAAAAATDDLLAHYEDPDGGIFTTADDAEELLVRPRETTDGATPSASSTAAVVLTELAALTGDSRYTAAAERILEALSPVAVEAPLAFGRLLCALDMATNGVTEVVVTGDREDLVRTAQRTWSPATVLAWGEPGTGPLWEGRSETGAGGRAYVCHDHVCDSPVGDPAELAALLVPAH